MDGIISWFRFVADNLDDVVDLSLEHLLLTFAPVTLAIIVSVGLGIIFRHQPAIQNLNLAIAGVFLTIPSLALFSISIRQSRITLRVMCTHRSSCSRQSASAVRSASLRFSFRSSCTVISTSWSTETPKSIISNLAEFRNLLKWS